MVSPRPCGNSNPAVLSAGLNEQFDIICTIQRKNVKLADAKLQPATRLAREQAGQLSLQRLDQQQRHYASIYKRRQEIGYEDRSDSASGFSEWSII